MPNKNLIFLISGKARSGKDTLAKLIVDLLEAEGFFVFRCALADHLKRETAKAYGVPLESLYDPRTKERYRTALTLRADRAKERFGLSYFCDKAVESFTTALVGRDEGRVALIVSDVRYPYEVEFLKTSASELLGNRNIPSETFVVRVESNRRSSVSSEDHSSETSMEDYGFDKVFFNDLSLIDLENEVRSYLIGNI